jgi:hypothetical protein
MNISNDPGGGRPARNASARNKLSQSENSPEPTHRVAAALVFSIFLATLALSALFPDIQSNIPVATGVATWFAYVLGITKVAPTRFD